MIDVEKLKRELADKLSRLIPNSYSDATMNNVIDYLTTRNLLGGVPQWQPIESAPKDGTHILVVDQGVVSEAYYNEYGNLFSANTCESDYIDGRLYYATHWMLLPAEPNAAEVG